MEDGIDHHLTVTILARAAVDHGLDGDAHRQESLARAALALSTSAPSRAEPHGCSTRCARRSGTWAAASCPWPRSSTR